MERLMARGRWKFRLIHLACGGGEADLAECRRLPDCTGNEGVHLSRRKLRDSGRDPLLNLQRLSWARNASNDLLLFNTVHLSEG